MTIFLTTPSLEVLEQRLRKRGTDTEAVMQKRLAMARQEVAQWKNFDYLIISGSSGGCAPGPGDCGGGENAHQPGDAAGI